MPYSSNKDLPENIKSSLPAAAQTVYRTVFNAQVATGKSEDTSRKIAWAAVKNGWEKTDEEWVRKIAPKPLYVSRKLLNAKDLIAWAKDQGFKATVPAEEMHVTICYSKQPVDWFGVGTHWQEKLEVPKGGPRAVEQFGDNATVLVFAANDLCWRHKDFIEAGASFDYDKYQPHVTISYEDAPEKIEPYQGKLVFGPEIFDDLNEDWKDDLVEKIEFSINGTISKTNDEERLAFGLFSVLNKANKDVIDLEDDGIKTNELEKAAYNYVINHRDASVNHKDLGVGDLVESMVFTKEKVESLKKALTDAGIPHTIEIDGEFWWGGHFVKNDDVWDGVKSGKFESWSIGGTGSRRKADG